jgi:acetyl esterase/lipase
MRYLIIGTMITLMSGLALTTQIQAQQQSSTSSFPLWPAGATTIVGQGPDDVPTLTPYIAKDNSTGAAVVVCPGGGYAHLADHEGGPVAEWLNSIGITAFVLKYRHGPHYQHPVPLQDAARAIRTIRARAAEWHLDPKRIGILGFSAGGHLAATLGTHYDSGSTSSVDLIERVSSRPDLLILIYPVISMAQFTHQGSKRMLLGENPGNELVTLLSNELQVTKDTPPTFLVHTSNDESVPVENSLLFAEALRKAGVQFELHVYERGKHGFGLAPGDPILSTWPARCGAWLHLHGF